MPSDSGQMTKSDAARIQAANAKAGGDTSAGSFPARAQAAADKHVNEARAAAAQNDKGNQDSNFASRSSGGAGGNQGAGEYGAAHRGGN